jgi:hypothetical protein
MDVIKVLASLRQERAQLEEVIANLERLEQSRERRRGRPPAILTAPRKRGRPRGSKNKTHLPVKNPMFAMEEHRPRVMAAGQTTIVEDSGPSSDVM